MGAVKDFIELIFSAALFLNAALFIPQALEIVRKKTAKGVSLTTFLGFVIIQIAITLHAIITHDLILLIGYLLSLITCGSVVILIFTYRKKKTTLADEISLENIIAQLPGHVYWKDVRGVFSGTNDNNLKDFGMNSLADYVGKTDYDIFSKEEANQIRILDEEVIREYKTVVAEEYLTNSDGTKAFYLSHKKPLINKRGNIVGLLGCSLDITESKQLTFEQLTMLENIIAVMPGNVYWMNKDGVYLGCNDNEAKAVGLSSRKEIVGKLNEDISGFVIPEALEANNQEVLEHGKTIIKEEPAILPNGQKAIFLSHKAPIRDSQENIVGLVGISIDITERKNQEQELRKAKNDAEQSDVVKQEFIRNMEHDIRTPFVGIYGMIELLASQEQDAEKKSLLKDVALCAKELMDYCDGILEFSKVESASFPLLSKSFMLKRMLESVITIESVAAKDRKLELSLEYDHHLPVVVMGDQFRLKRMLINLVSNAIKFTDEGKVTLSAQLESISLETRELVIKFMIRDTGIGIAENHQALIFERFTKVAPSNNGAYKGMGLGLNIVKQFVDELNGDIHLKSELGHGTTFIVYLPFKLPLCDEIIDED